jgi:hypothetical protein
MGKGVNQKGVLVKGSLSSAIRRQKTPMRSGEGAFGSCMGKWVRDKKHFSRKGQTEAFNVLNLFVFLTYPPIYPEETRFVSTFLSKSNRRVYFLLQRYPSAPVQKTKGLRLQSFTLPLIIGSSLRIDRFAKPAVSKLSTVFHVPLRALGSLFRRSESLWLT